MWLADQSSRWPKVRHHSYNQVSEQVPGPVMQIFLDGRFSEPVRSPSDLVSLPATSEAPRLLITLTPWSRVFFGNILDGLLFFRRQPPLQLSSRPAPFWDDVFVTRKLPFSGLRQSALYHFFIVTALWGLSHTLMLRRPDLPARSPFEHQTITYYSVSEYLPPINDATEPPPAKNFRRGNPAYAKQFIRSIRSDAESHTQTIVAPPRLKLPHDVSLPNIVAWTPVPAAVPEAAARHDANQLIAPAMQETVAPPAPSATPSLAHSLLDQQASVVEPSPAVDKAKLRVPSDIVAKVVEPAPSLRQAQVNKANLPVPSAVEPAPTTGKRSPIGDINMAAKLTVIEPALALPEQRARGSLLDGTAEQAISKGVNGNVGAVPPAPSAQGLSGGQAGGSQAAGQLLALGINPVAVAGPIRVPQGNRPGTFQAGPEGKPDAPGTPDIKGGGTGNQAGGNGKSKQSADREIDRSGNSLGPNGITVGRGAVTPAGNVVVAGTPKPSVAKDTPNLDANKKLLASLGHTSVADLARNARPGAMPVAPEPKLEDKVFDGKKYYQITLNMPNLTSRGGSWIVRFAELNVSQDQGELTAPVAVQKVDPAYSGDLLREQVEGTVVLYAIIHSDGSVGEVRVLRGVDDRLDARAREAFTKWHFRPATKNGRGVDLEAVVQIPFIAKRPPY